MRHRVLRAGEEMGTFSEDDIRRMLERGELVADDVACAEGATEWVPLGARFSQVSMLSPPPLPGGGTLRMSPSPPACPESNLLGAVLVTVLCCLPFGIPSIVYAAQVTAKYAAGDYIGAERSASQSRKWMWLAFGFGLPVQLLFMLASLAQG